MGGLPWHLDRAVNLRGDLLEKRIIPSESRQLNRRYVSVFAFESIGIVLYSQVEVE